MLTFLASAAEYAFADGGETSFGASLVSPDPVRTSLGYSGAASSASSPWAVLTNPSNLIGGSSCEFSLSYQKWSPDGVSQNVGAFGGDVRIGKNSSIGFAGSFGKGESYEIISSNYVRNGSFTPSEVSLALGWGILFADKFSVGISANYLGDKLYKDVTLKAVSADILFSASLSGFRLTGGVSHLGGSFGDYSADLPTYALAAASWNKSFSEAHSLTLNLDGSFFFTGDCTAAFGAEYAFRNAAFLRGGYHAATSDSPLPSFAAAGVGGKYKWLRADVSYIFGNESLGGGFSFSLGFRF